MMKNKIKFIFLFLTAFSFAQQTKSVDFKSIKANVEINPVKRNIVGKCEYTFCVKQKTDTIRIDAQKMVFTNLKINNKTVKYKASTKELLLFDGIKKGNNTLNFEYEAFPTQAMYFVNWDFSNNVISPEQVQGQIWTQGQGRYTSNWLPSFDDENEKVIFGLTITFHKSFEVISNGILKHKTSIGDNISWQYSMQKPMSSYLLVLAIGHFQNQNDKALSGIPLEYYYEKEDINRVEPTYRNSKQIFDFFEKEIGVPYPWEIYRQIPVRDFLYAGMENTTTTLFSRDFVEDSIGYNDRNYLNINAHELAHHWFGNLVTAQSGKDHWLQEGFATYYALLAEREVFGDNYFYKKFYDISRQVKQASKKDSIPILNKKASSLSLYQKGGLALFALRESLGREKFNLAVKNYLKKYSYKNVTTDDFLKEINLISTFDTKVFRETWLEKTIFPQEEVDRLFQKNEFIQQYIQHASKPLDLVKDKGEMLKIMQGDAYFSIKELLVYLASSKPFEAKAFLMSAALATNDLNVRQAVASSMHSIPESFRLEFETLLQDKSYATQEIALFSLWKQFPEHQKRYLDLAKDWIGFQNKNLKLLYLSLSYLSSDDSKEKFNAYRELLSYTGTNYDSNLQQDALDKLLDLKIYNEDIFRSLAYGTANHRWQFVKFSRDNIRILLKEQKYRVIFTNICPELPIREKTQLQRLLDEK